MKHEIKSSPPRNGNDLEIPELKLIRIKTQARIATLGALQRTAKRPRPADPQQPGESGPLPVSEATFIPMRSTTRIQMELSEASMERLRQLKEKTEATSYAEVAKNAFKLLELVIELTETGEKLCIRDKKGVTRDLELFV
jgi:hypothetical protein